MSEWLGGVDAQAGPRTPQLVRSSADFLLIITSLCAGKGVALRASNSDGDGIHALLSIDFWRGDLYAIVSLSAFSVAIFWAFLLYGRGRQYKPVSKLILVAAAVGTAFLANWALSRGIPALDIGQGTLTWACAVAVPLMICARLWSLVWRHVLAVEGAVAAAPATISSRPRAQSPVLLIGGAGYIGSSLLPKLLQQRRHVRLMDVYLYGRDAIGEWLTHPNLEIIEADFRHVDSLVKATQGVAEVIHLGGIVGDPACGMDEELTIDVNLAATRAVAAVAKGAGAQKLIFASSCSVYGANDCLIDESCELNPLSLYARTKIASEKILLSMRDTDFEPIILRFSTVYGISGRTRFDLVINLLTAKAVIDGVITVINGQQWRPFIHVDDVARAIMAFVDNERHVQSTLPIFNVGGNAENYTLSQVGGIVKGLVPQAKLVLLENDDDRRDYRVNFEKIRNAVGFETRWTVEEGVRQVIQTIRRLQIHDYAEPRFSNVKALSAAADVLSRPEPNWAHQLVASL